MTLGLNSMIADWQHRLGAVDSGSTISLDMTAMSASVGNPIKSSRYLKAFFARFMEGIEEEWKNKQQTSNAVFTYTTLDKTAIGNGDALQRLRAHLNPENIARIAAAAEEEIYAEAPEQVCQPYARMLTGFMVAGDVKQSPPHYYMREDIHPLQAEGVIAVLKQIVTRMPPGDDKVKISANLLTGDSPHLRFDGNPDNPLVSGTFFISHDLTDFLRKHIGRVRELLPQVLAQGAKKTAAASLL